MSGAEAIVFCIFFIWIILTIVAQVPNWALSGRLRRASFCGFQPIPSWCFFAPHPCVTNFWLMARDYSRSGDVGPWRRVRCGHSRRPVKDWFFHPEKRVRKAFFDVVQSLMQLGELSSVSRELIQLQPAYLFLLSHVLEHSPPARDSVATQFAVLEVLPGELGENCRVLFQSGVHPHDVGST